MKRDDLYYKELLRKYTNNECSPEEIGILMEFLRTRKSDRLLLSEISDWYYNAEARGEEKMTEQQSKRIKKLLLNAVQPEKSFRTALWKGPFFQVAAAFFLICAGVYWFYMQRNASIDHDAGAEAKAIMPGTEKAVIMFSDGTALNLTERSRGLLYNKNGLMISRAHDGAIHYEVPEGLQRSGALNVTLTTPVGGECRVVLPDGSKLWMNARSVVAFPVVFAKNERRVTARGEVYFEVAKDAKKPFKVFSGGQSIEVLGTHFVVNTNADNTEIKTTLLEGSIRLSNGKVTKVLHPGQESQLSAERDEIVVATRENPEAAAAWKDGYFDFDGTDFKTVEEQISKWYDVEFVYDQLPSSLFYGKIEREIPLEKVLQMLEIVGGIHFKTEGRKVYVTK